jgi:hypothetical protein
MPTMALGAFVFAGELSLSLSLSLSPLAPKGVFAEPLFAFSHGSCFHMCSAMAPPARL